MVPGLQRYVEEGVPEHFVDGGYYTKVPDNMPVIGEVAGGPSGAYTCGCLSGYGIMAANGAGELVAQIVAEDSKVPGYKDDFAHTRWHDAEYLRRVEAGEVGGLQI